MTVLSIAAAEGLDVSRSDQVGAHQVYWRLGAFPRATPAELSAIARDWLEQLVASAGLFAWRGLTADVATGKPRPVGASNAAVSISHSGHHVLVGACLGARLGVDIESLPFNAFDSGALVRRMCTPEEAAKAAGLEQDQRRRYLSRVWTTKEAHVKATGSGLATDFRTLRSGASLDASSQPFEAHIAVIDHQDHASYRRLTLEENNVQRS